MLYYHKFSSHSLSVILSVVKGSSSDPHRTWHWSPKMTQQNPFLSFPKLQSLAQNPHPNSPPFPPHPLIHHLYPTNPCPPPPPAPPPIICPGGGPPFGPPGPYTPCPGPPPPGPPYPPWPCTGIGPAPCCDCTSGRWLRSCMKWQMGQASSLYLCVARGRTGTKQRVNQGLCWGTVSLRGGV